MATTRRPAGEKENIEVRRVKVLELRKAGASTRQIATQVGVSHKTVAADIKAVLAVLLGQQLDSAEAMRQMELERLDMAMLAIAPQVRQGHLGAIREWRGLIDQRAKLLGLYAPVRQDVTSGGAKLTGLLVNLGDDDSE